MIIQNSLLEKTIDQALSGGADFAEVFIEDTYSSALGFIDQKPDELNFGKKKGAGIRLFYGTEIIYVSTSDLTEDGLLTAAATASQAIKGTSKTLKDPMKNLSYTPYSTCKLLPWDLQTAQKIEFLKRADKAARSMHSDITQVSGTVLEKVQKVQIANSLGLLAQEQRNYSRFVVSAIAERGGEKQSGMSKLGALRGSEFYDNLDVEAMAKEASRQALTMVDAAFAPAAECPVVLDNGFGGVIFHEACGHGLETTSVANGASVFCDKLGEKLAHECVTAVDDGTIENKWGSIGIDDEGMPTKKTVLIEKGVLKSYIVDQMGAKKTGYTPTGSGRRQDYTYAPASRMRNTYIAPGEDSLEQLLKKMDNGIYCKKMGGGSVNPGTGAYNFSVQEAYKVEGGEIKQPLKGASLIGTGIETLGRITAVGNNFELDCGMCGSVSGSIPTTVGQPAILISNITVGGRAQK